MASTPKCLRKWVKEEKRLVKLLYQKGFLTGPHSLEGLYWAEYKPTGKKHKYGKHNFPSYYPEIHFCTRDYWGEYDEYALVDKVLEEFYWSEVKVDDMDDENFNYPPSETKITSRAKLLAHLKTLQTVIKDSNINKVIRMHAI